MAAAANVSKLILRGHSGANGTDEVDRSLDIDVDCLGEHVELQVRSYGPRNIAQLRNLARYASLVGSEH